MKANEAPGKIYLEKVYPDNGVLPNGLNYNQSPNDIEYTRTDAFIEKACGWLKNNVEKYYYLDEAYDRVINTKNLNNDFKKYIED